MQTPHLAEIEVHPKVAGAGEGVKGGKAVQCLDARIVGGKIVMLEGLQLGCVAWQERGCGYRDGLGDMTVYA